MVWSSQIYDSSQLEHNIKSTSRESQYAVMKSQCAIQKSSPWNFFIKSKSTPQDVAVQSRIIQANKTYEPCDKLPTQLWLPQRWRWWGVSVATSWCYLGRLTWDITMFAAIPEYSKLWCEITQDIYLYNGQKYISWVISHHNLLYSGIAANIVMSHVSLPR